MCGAVPALFILHFSLFTFHFSFFIFHCHMHFPLPASFYLRPTVTVARELLGCIVARRWRGAWLTGRIVETEAYPSGDAANHAARGKGKRNAPMFGPPGTAYVYTIHTHWLLNAVTQPAGVAEAVLIRALEPLEGIEAMRRARKMATLRDLCRGPGRLCQALRIGRRFNTRPLTGGDLVVLPRDEPVGRVLAARRIGIREAAEQPWRFYVAGSRFVSRP